MHQVFTFTNAYGHEDTRFLKTELCCNHSLLEAHTFHTADTATDDVESPLGSRYINDLDNT